MIKYIYAAVLVLSLNTHAAVTGAKGAARTNASTTQTTKIGQFWDEYRKKEHKVMPVIGMTAFQLNGMKVKTSDGNGYTVGVLIEDKVRSDLKLQYGLQYYQANSEHTAYIEDIGRNVDVDIERKYLGVPAFFVKELSPGNKKAYLKGGGILSYMIDTKGISRETANEVYLNTKFKRPDLMASAGVGYRIHQPKLSTLSVEATYHRGLIDVVRGSGPSNRGLSAGYMFTAGVMF
jgi:Outer membrane protein beta-barrel domain